MFPAKGMPLPAGGPDSGPGYAILFPAVPATISMQTGLPLIILRLKAPRIWGANLLSASRRAELFRTSIFPILILEEPVAWLISPMRRVG